MTVTIADVMRETRNYFPRLRLTGDWALTQGALSPNPGLRARDFLAIERGPLCAGVRQADANGLIPDAADESWQGGVWLLCPTGDFIRLCAAIAAFAQTASPSGLSAERFGSYSASYQNGATGVPLTWQEVFERDLRPFRRMFTEVNL